MPLIDDPALAAATLRDIVAEARRVLPFTGAGISTEAGIPDFRSPGSLWTRNKPIPFDAFLASAEVRAEAWRRKFTMDDGMAGAEPAIGHRAIARLHAIGRAPVVVTQNIDGLHQRSGLPAEAIVELHGNGTYAACVGCGARHELADIRPRFEATGVPPDCAGCGEPVKSATISFGQAMPREPWRRAVEAAARCDVMLVVGSSLVVAPANTLPEIARGEGAVLVILNREPTPLDAIADLVLRAEIGPAMAPLLSLGGVAAGNPQGLG